MINELKVELDKSKKFFFSYFMLSMVALILGLLLPSYLDYKATEAISARLDDIPLDNITICNPKLNGLGEHCFGDFYYNLQFGLQDLPWAQGLNPNPPLATAFYAPFSFLHNVNPSSHLALIIFFIVSFICVSIPAFHGYKSKRLDRKSSLIVGMFIFIASPLLIAIDRGSSHLLLVPFYYFFVLAILEYRTKSIFKWGLILVLLKPQMILLGLIFLSKREYKKFSIWIMMSLFFSFLAFILYFKNFLLNIQQYLESLSTYQSYTNAGSLYPVNISIANSWSIIERVVVTNFPGLSEKNPSEKWQFYSFYISIFILFLLCINLILFGHLRSSIENIFIVISIPILLPNVSFAYYLLIYTAPLIIILAETLSLQYGKSQFLRLISGLNSESILLIFHKKRNYLIFSITFFLLYVPWSIPWNVIAFSTAPFWSKIGINWLPGQFFLLILFSMFILKGIKFRKSSEI